MKNRRAYFNPDKLVLLKQIGKGLLVIATLGLIVTAVWYGTRLPALTLVSVEVSGGETIDHALVRTQVERGLEGEYLNLIPKRFVWFYPQMEILTTIKKIEKIHNVTVSRLSSTELAVTFDEYIPQALWCQAVEQLECLLLDENSYAFGQAPQLAGGSLLRFVKTGVEPVVGQSVTSAETIINLNILVGLLSEQSWFVSHVEIDQVDDIFLKLVGGGELKIIATDDPVAVVDNLLVILNSEEFSHLKPGNFQYIDLRFGNKVFVNEEEENASSTVEFGA